MSAFRVKLGANDLNCVDVPLNPTHRPRPCNRRNYHSATFDNDALYKLMLYFTSIHI